MGCGCCILTFRDEVEGEILSYINRIKNHERNKKTLIFEIQKDLTKRAAVVDKYNYPYRKEDVKKTVNIYKNYIYRKYKGNLELLEDKIKSKKKVIENKIKEDDKQLTLNNKTNNYNTIEFEKDKKLNESKKDQKDNNNDNKKNNENIENIKSSKKEKNSKKIDDDIKSDLQPMLEDKLKNLSEQDESDVQKKSIDNKKDKFLPKEENSQIELRDKIIENKEKNLRYREDEESNEKSIEDKNKDNIEKKSIQII